MKNSIKFTVAAAGLAVALSPLAANAVSSSVSKTVSCDTGYETSIGAYYHAAAGTITVRQNSTTPVITSAYNGISSNGNSLGYKSTGDGGSVSWGSVKVGTYTIVHKPTANTNCNGVAPGNGNTTASVTVTY